MKVFKLTQEQAEQLKGKQFDDSSFFNPIQDADDNWIISKEEIELSDIEWLAALEEIEYNPKQVELLNPNQE